MLVSLIIVCVRKTTREKGVKSRLYANSKTENFYERLDENERQHTKNRAD